jgi:hypothetical protein
MGDCCSDASACCAAHSGRCGGGLPCTAQYAAPRASRPPPPPPPRRRAEQDAAAGLQAAFGAMQAAGLGGR